MAIDSKAVFRNLFAMDTIVHSLNDEDLTEIWMTNFVPDGCDCEGDIEEYYGGMADDDLFREYEAAAKCFAKLVKRATEDGEEMWTSVGYVAPSSENASRKDRKFRVGQKVSLNTRRLFVVGGAVTEIEPSEKFIVLDCRDNIFVDGLNVYEILNERIGRISVDESEICLAE